MEDSSLDLDQGMSQSLILATEILVGDMDGSSHLDFHHHPIDLMILYDLMFQVLCQIQNQNYHIHHQVEAFSPDNSHFSQ
jgi:hypothetical protein